MSASRIMNSASVEAFPRSRADSDRWAGCVSVIVPVYNEIAHVDKLLPSITILR